MEKTTGLATVLELTVPATSIAQLKAVEVTVAVTVVEGINA
jgi:hypothetical protein